MWISDRSRAFLELLFITGIDVLEASTSFGKTIYKSGGWENDRAFNRYLRAMEEKGLIDCGDSRSSGSWVAKITNKGRSLACNDIDLESAWNSNWDGKWRLMAFDLPQFASHDRYNLRRWLKSRRLGLLQGSVWITPYPCEKWLAEDDALKIDPTALVFFEGSPIGNRSDSEIVSQAWDFKKLNTYYENYLEFASKPFPKNAIGDPSERFAKWRAKESELWKTAFETDPALPKQLLPTKYSGEKALAARKSAYANWIKLLQNERS